VSDLPKVPSGFRTQDPATREDLERLRRFLEQLVKRPSGGGSGTIEQITSADTSVTITNPTGPTVDLSVDTTGAVSSVQGTGAIDVTPTTGATVVSLDKSELENGGSQELNLAGLSGELADPQPPKAHKTSHQNGGSDEINVGGLDGVLADPQKIEVAQAGSLIGTRDRINFIDGTGVSTTVADDAGNDRVNITINASSAASPSEYWSTANSFDALDQEMLGPTFPPTGFSIWRQNLSGASTAFGGTPGNNPVGANFTPASNAIDYQYENSWLWVGASGTGGGSSWDSWYIGRRIAARPKYGIFRARLKTLQDNANSVGLRESAVFLLAAKETSSAPDTSSIHYSGISTESGKVSWTGDGLGGALLANWGATSLVYMQDAEVFISFEDTQVRSGINGPNGILPYGSFVSSNFAIGAPFYIGILLNIFGGSPGRAGVDYLRQRTHASNPIPLR
jgi:hypothetical protein